MGAGGPPHAAQSACFRSGGLRRFLRNAKTSPSTRVRHESQIDTSLCGGKALRPFPHTPFPTSVRYATLGTPSRRASLVLPGRRSRSVLLRKTSTETRVRHESRIGGFLAPKKKPDFKSGYFFGGGRTRTAGSRRRGIYRRWESKQSQRSLTRINLKVNDLEGAKN